MRRRRVLGDAFAIGARYVELRDRSGRLRATASDRLLDLEAAGDCADGVRSVTFLTSRPIGSLPDVQRGQARRHRQLPTTLVIGNRNVPPDTEHFLTPQANAVMKGVRQNELNPFLRRLSREGLWEFKTSFERLDRAKRDLILFGFWSRPGAGSFLKSPQANPAEVSSWLRWDGLYRHVYDQADRSRDVQWAGRVLRAPMQYEDLSAVLCAASGLQLASLVLLRVGDVSLAEWTLLAHGGRMLDLQYAAVEPHTPASAAYTQQRILFTASRLFGKPDSAGLPAASCRAIRGILYDDGGSSQCCKP